MSLIKNTALLAIFITTFNVYAMGPSNGGGGDLACDAKIQNIADNLRSWIKDHGDQSGVQLNLSSSLHPITHQAYTFSQYESAMLELLAKPIDANCVRNGDADYPVRIGKTTKICKTSFDHIGLHMICDRELFLNLTDDQKIEQIHHEIAINAAGLEPDIGPISTYRISVQLSASIQDVPERKLVVMSSATALANSAKLRFLVSPQYSYLLPGSASTCTDYADYKKAILTHATSVIPPLAQSAVALRVSFPDFVLTWESDDYLFIESIKFAIHAPQIRGGQFESKIQGRDLSAILGSSTNSFMGRKGMLNSADLKVNPNANGTISSRDQARNCGPDSIDLITGAPCERRIEIFSRDYAACGLDIGGITLSDYSKEFTAKYDIEIVGYSVNQSGVQTPVYAEQTGSVMFSGVN